VYGEGPLSDAITITPASVPNAPTDLKMISANSTQITIMWNEAYNGGNSVK